MHVQTRLGRKRSSAIPLPDDVLKSMLIDDKVGLHRRPQAAARRALYCARDVEVSPDLAGAEQGFIIC
jgi:hypothetical protein